MKKSILFIIFIFSVSLSKAFYYAGLDFYPIINGCEVRGFGKYPLDAFQGSTLIIPGTAIDEHGESHTVVQIAANAFSGITEIEHVVIPGSVRVIGEGAFAACVNLKECNLYASTQEIGAKAFYGCLSMTMLNTCAEKIGYEAFSGCISLSAVYLGAPMKVIDVGAFKSCSVLTNIDIPFTVEQLGDAPGWLGHDGVFEDCISLMAVTFVYNLTDKLPRLKSIGSNTFKNCINLPRIDFPYSVTTINADAFLRCTSLKHIEWGGPAAIQMAACDFTGVPISRIVFHGDVTGPTTLFHGMEDLKEIRYDTYATRIPFKAYENMTSLKSVDLDHIIEIDGFAFAGCTGLEHVSLSPQLEDLGYNAFQNCTSLTSIEMPASLMRIREYAFEGCKNLKNIKLNEGLKSVMGGAFRGCTALEEIVFPMSVTTLTVNALDNCTALKSITMGGYEPLQGGIAFALQSPVEELVLRGNVWGLQCSGWKTLKSVLFTDYCDTVSSDEFMNCTGLTSLDLGNIVSIGWKGFGGCTGLTSVDLSNVEKLELYAFERCENLKSVRFGSKITEVPDCFSYCGLTDFNVPDNVTSLQTPTNCPRLETVTLGNGLTSYFGDFNGCDALTNLYLGENIEQVSFYPSSLRKLICSNPEPPRSQPFKESVYENAVLIVPEGSGNAYREANVWKKFFNIVEEDLSNVESVEEGINYPVISLAPGTAEIKCEEPAVIYSTAGTLLENLQPGIHRITLPHGIYLLVSGKFSTKILL